MHHLPTAGLALALLMSIGCGGSQKPAPARQATCTEAAANNEKVILALGQQQGEDMTMMATAGRETYAEHCVADGWSQEIIDCAVAAADAEQMMACAERLTPEQHEAMAATFGAKMGFGTEE